MNKKMNIIPLFLLVTVMTTFSSAQSVTYKTEKNTATGTNIEQRTPSMAIDDRKDLSDGASMPNIIRIGTAKEADESILQKVRIMRSNDTDSSDNATKPSTKILEHFWKRYGDVFDDSVAYHLQNGRNKADVIFNNESVSKIIGASPFFLYCEYYPERITEYIVVIRRDDCLIVVWNWDEMNSPQKYCVVPCDNNVLTECFDILLKIKPAKHILKSRMDIDLGPFRNSYALSGTRPAELGLHAYFAVFNSGYDLVLDWVDNAFMDKDDLDCVYAVNMFDQFVKGFTNSCLYGTCRVPIEIHY